MSSWFKKTILAASLGAAALTTSAPAEAQRWHGGGWHGGYGYRGGWGPGAAVGAGVLGFALGAAVAQPRYYSYDGYYGRPYYYPRCERVMRWDPYYGDYVPVRYCD